MSRVIRRSQIKRVLLSHGGVMTASQIAEKLKAGFQKTYDTLKNLVFDEVENGGLESFHLAGVGTVYKWIQTDIELEAAKNALLDKPKYVICPRWVNATPNSKRHYVDESMLAERYKVNLSECYVNKVGKIPKKHRHLPVLVVEGSI